ncbi:MAG: M20/M25/M40 family metallo-hydrolase [Labilithrix sp.]|nr:M20/M25/M40 family metallo-hydrolase [Labilithrix sp.]MCW5836049.1 M20/M25/M40 family metallo-hydrolase [Labilithrix sp.]
MKRASLVLGSSGLLALLVAACGSDPPPPKAPAPPPGAPLPPTKAIAEETHLGDVKQLTLAGENAEAYWSFGGRELVLQSRTGDADCDRIYRMPLSSVLGAAPGARETLPPFIPVSSGKGATTCSYFMPGDQKVIYASTHLGGDACPPKPDHSQGYVWPLYDSYDIFKADADGSNVVRLTDAKGYDAEATVCAKDGSIVFTSVRDGDIELYRMDADGKNVKRLTNTPGYDGGAFFNADCSKIVWRASRPKPGKELDDFKRLLGQSPPLVRPSKLELYVANADGSDAQQITYLDAASFAPYWHPSQKRLLFSTNYGDPKGREFDIWAVNVDGTALERVTYAGGFDGFPMFSPDGSLLAFASNRATAPGKHDTNVFLAKWIEDVGAPKIVETGADRIKKDVAWLADPAREGRGVGLPGLEASGKYIEDRMKALGLQPAGDDAAFRQPFPVVTNLKQDDATALEIGGKPVAKEDFVVLGYSPQKANVAGDLVFADYGIVAKDLGRDDYAKLDVKKKVVVVRRFVPGDGKFATPDAQRRFGDIRRKAFWAREKGAAGLVVVDDPARPADAPADWKPPEEAKLPALQPEGYSDAGLPVLVLKRAAGQPLVERLQKKQATRAKIDVALSPVSSQAFNVAGRLVAEPKDQKKLPGVIVIGAHYDHLGRGGRHSLAPHADAPHVGADDNASGAATLLEVARELAAKKGELRRDVVFVAFSGEESGVLGSAHFVQKWIAAENAGKPKNAKAAKASDKATGIYAMLNMDMVGRMRENRLQVLGAETATEWKEIVTTACEASRVSCAPSGDGYGPSDQINFFSAGVPVLHFFTGTHTDYHKPSDTADKVNAAGAMQTGKICASVALTTSQREAPLSFKADAEGPAPHGDMRSFNASLGTIPDYGGPGAGKKGVLLSGVRPGGAAEKAGMRKGDVLVRLGKSEIASVEDLMFVLNASKPGETVPAIVVRDGKETKLEVTFQESQRPK